MSETDDAPCVGVSGAALCAEYGRSCGALSAVDNCQVLRDELCDACLFPDSCGGAGDLNACGRPAWQGFGTSEFGPWGTRVRWGSATIAGISDSPGSADDPAVALDSSGIPTIAWLDSGNIYLRRLEGDRWLELDGSASNAGLGSTGFSVRPGLDIDSKGQPCVAWEASPEREIHVRCYDGTAWQELAGSATGAGISNTVAISREPIVLIDGSDRPYVAWSDQQSGNYEIYLKRWDGAAWQEVGAGSASGGGISVNSGYSAEPQMILDVDGLPIIVWSDRTPGEYDTYVRKFDGSVWQEMGVGSATGGGISNNGGRSRSACIALDSTDAPVVAWLDSTGVSTFSSHLYVRRFNGTAWQELPTGSATGSGLFPSAQASHALSMTLHDGKLTLAWENSNAARYELFAASFNGTAWQSVPLAGAAAAEISRTSAWSLAPHMAAGAGKLWTVWSEIGAGEIYARHFDGVAWMQLPSNAEDYALPDENSIGGAPVIAIDSTGLPIIAWAQSQIYVLRYDGNDWVTMGAGSDVGEGVSNTGAYSDQLRIALNSDDQPTVVWREFSTPRQIYGRRYDGTAWVELAGSGSGGGISNSSGNSSVPCLELDPSGDPVVAWQDNTSGMNQVYVSRFDGSAWLPMGTASNSGDGISASPTGASSPALAMHASGSPIVAWTDTPAGINQVFLRQWVTNAWVEIGTSASGNGISNTADPSTSPSIAIAQDGQPWVAWRVGSGIDIRIYVSRFDGNAWVEATTGSMQGDGASGTRDRHYDVRLKFDHSGRATLSWTQLHSKSDVYILRAEGDAWVEMGSGSASDGGVSNTQGASRPYDIESGVGGISCATWRNMTDRGDRIAVRCHWD